jgi:hypothetical protein
MTYQEALQASRILELLGRFEPTVVGTLPLDLAVASSDIDIVCAAHDPDAFANVVWDSFRHIEGFRLYRWRDDGRPAVARFEFGGWPFELFADQRPVSEQRAWRHFDVERRLLALDSGGLRETVLRLRAEGLKTEPAFAEALKLDGDPYLAMLALFPESDAQLRARLANAVSQ